MEEVVEVIVTNPSRNTKDVMVGLFKREHPEGEKPINYVILKPKDMVSMPVTKDQEIRIISA